MDKNILRAVAHKHPSLVLQPFDTLMGLSGFDAIYAICETMGGGTVYVPSARKMFSECLAKEALAEFTGYNHEGLAEKYGFTARHMRRLLAQDGA